MRQTEQLRDAWLLSEDGREELTNMIGVFSVSPPLGTQADPCIFQGIDGMGPARALIDVWRESGRPEVFTLRGGCGAMTVVAKY